jgi:hypothetical protein
VIFDDDDKGEAANVVAIWVINEESRKFVEVELYLCFFVVQPGLSIAAVSREHLMLLAVTERYLSDTYEIPFSVFCSA